MKECMGSHLYLEPFLHISLTDNISSERHKYAFSVRFMWEDFLSVVTVEQELQICKEHFTSTQISCGSYGPVLSFIRFFQSFSFVCFSPPYFSVLTASGLIFYRLQRTLHWAY